MQRCDLVLMFVESVPCALPERQAVGCIADRVQTLLSVRECKGRNLQRK